jgi:hypothetical protein
MEEGSDGTFPLPPGGRVCDNMYGTFEKEEESLMGEHEGQYLIPQIAAPSRKSKTGEPLA